MPLVFRVLHSVVVLSFINPQSPIPAPPLWFGPFGKEERNPPPQRLLSPALLLLKYLKHPQTRRYGGAAEEKRGI